MNAAIGAAKAIPIRTTKDLSERVFRFCQDCLRKNPVLVIGSGASISSGLPRMGALGEALVNRIEVRDLSSVDMESWNRFKTLLPEHGLEAAIEKAEFPRDGKMVEEIRRQTWCIIAECDTNACQLVLTNKRPLPVGSLIKHMLKGDSTKVTVVTTNYDRLIEYASSAAGFPYRTGFQPGYGGQWRSSEPSLEFWRRGKRVPEKTVEIWKVHGSLDWFEHEKQYISVPVHTVGPPMRNVPQASLSAFVDEATPLIVPPGTSKHAETHEEPFRTIFRGADDALTKAGAVFCVGYGFNDDHVQPKLIERVTRDRIPIVILARTLTPRARQIFIESTNVQEWMALEQIENRGTMVYSSENKEEFCLQAEDIWDLSHFVQRVI